MVYEWVSPEMFLKYEGVTIYHTYRHDEPQQGPRQYWYGWNEDCQEGGDTFDVRELPNPNSHDVHTPEGQKAIMRDAIDAGILTDGGIVSPGTSDGCITIQVPQEDWHLLLETLEKDAESSAFDPELRERIRAALENVRPLTGIAELVELAEDVLEWAAQTGGWDALCWQRLRQVTKIVAAQLQSDRGGNHAYSALQRVYDALYLESGPDGDVYNPDKEWSPDTLDEIADFVRPLFPPLDQA